MEKHTEITGIIKTEWMSKALSESLETALLVDRCQISMNFDGHYVDCMMTDTFHDLFRVHSVHPKSGSGVCVHFVLKNSEVLKVLKGHQIPMGGSE